jgi:hypothetical protein
MRAGGAVTSEKTTASWGSIAEYVEVMRISRPPMNTLRDESFRNLVLVPEHRP